MLTLPLSFVSGFANMLLVPLYISNGEVALASIIIVVRIGVVSISAFLLYRAFTKPLVSSIVRHQLHSTTIWIVACIFMIFDSSMIRLLPFKATGFAERSRGFPSMKVFKIAMYAHLFSSLASVILSGVGLVTNSSGFNVGSLVLSMLSFLMTLFIFLIKTIAERIDKHDVLIITSQALDDAITKAVAMNLPVKNNNDTSRGSFGIASKDLKEQNEKHSRQIEMILKMQQDQELRTRLDMEDLKQSMADKDEKIAQFKDALDVVTVGGGSGSASVARGEETRNPLGGGGRDGGRYR